MSTELKALMLKEPRWTLAVAESLTAGNLQAAIGAISGASNFFAGGITAYSLEQKVRQLGVDRAIAEPVNCVSREVAEQMARGACRLFGTTWAAATTGYAEPAPDQGIRTPFAWWAVCREGGTDMRSGCIEVPDASRVEVQRRVAAAVLGEILAAVRSARP